MRGGDVLKTGNVRKSEKRALLTPPFPEKDLIGGSSILKNVNGLSDRLIVLLGSNDTSRHAMIIGGSEYGILVVEIDQPLLLVVVGNLYSWDVPHLCAGGVN
jgi:hypothetical protein